MIKRLLQRWEEYSPQERYLLVGSLLLLLVVLFWYGVLTPLLNYRESEQYLADKAEKDLHWIQQQQDVLARLSRHQPNAKRLAIPLKNAAEQSAQQYKIDNIKLTSSNGDRLEANIESVPFNTLLLWLQDLEQRYAIQVQKLSLTQSDVRDGNAHSLVILFSRKAKTNSHQESKP